MYIILECVTRKCNDKLRDKISIFFALVFKKYYCIRFIICIAPYTSMLTLKIIVITVLHCCKVGLASFFFLLKFYMRMKQMEMCHIMFSVYTASYTLAQILAMMTIRCNMLKYAHSSADILAFTRTHTPREKKKRRDTMLNIFLIERKKKKKVKLQFYVMYSKESLILLYVLHCLCCILFSRKKKRIHRYILFFIVLYF